jgi:hypothetical protein
VSKRTALISHPVDGETYVIVRFLGRVNAERP